jgi:hypothetical protein
MILSDYQTSHRSTDGKSTGFYDSKTVKAAVLSRLIHTEDGSIESG